MIRGGEGEFENLSYLRLFSDIEVEDQLGDRFDDCVETESCVESYSVAVLLGCP
jgi:hypothetical protein